MTRYCKDLGRSGEQLAAQHLAASGYTILETNFTTRFAEIDIIAAIADYLVFVEVKTRTSAKKGLPKEAVTPAKQKKIILAAKQYIKARALDGQKRIRFDVMEIFSENDVCRINHIPHAFFSG
ncbi:MAG: YraN family protein [Desulfotignum sp.]|jgi:putative endonuclease|nr:YraN family protein [Desulfotignum sp.]